MDINNSFQDFINRSDDNTQAPSLGIVIKNIFISCDSENTGIVPIAKVIDFVAPFLQGNADALEELKKCLVGHVDDINSIDYETLYSNMKAWTEKISTTDNKDDDMECVDHVPPNSHSEANRPNVSIARDLFKSYTEWPESTILSAVELSNDSHEQCMAERCILENHILELQHQKTQVIEEVSRLRSEVTSYQDQNDSLQGNLDKLVKKLTNEQKVNENLQMERKKGDEVREELSCANKKIAKLEKTISSQEKVNTQLQQDYDVLQRQKQNLEQKINITDRKSEAVVINIRLLQSEIDSLRKDLVSEQETNVALLKQNEELQDVIEQCNINIDKYKLEKEGLDKLLRDQMNRNESPIDLNRTHNILNSSLQSNLESDDCDVLSPERRSNESNGECIYYNLHMVMSSSESLQDEIKKATNHDMTIDTEEEENGSDCQTRLNQIEVEKKLVALQCELLQHESCTDIISKQKEEIKHVSRENCSYKEQMQGLQEMLSDSRTQVSLSEEREQILLEKCRFLEESLKSSNSYVVKIQTKLSEYTDLENKCKMLDQKIGELEMDNSMKYIKIINLTVEIEKLREIQAKGDQQNKKELSKKISQLEEERRLHESETKELFGKIKVLNEEKVILQQEKETLLMRIIELENERCQLQSERDELRLAKETLEVENCEFKSKRHMVELQIGKIQSEQEALQMEKNLLKSENINLEIAKDELEANMKAHLEKLRKTVHCMEVENESLLVKMAMITEEKDKLEDVLNKYKNEEATNLRIKDKYEKTTGILEKLQKDHDLIKSNYDALENEVMKEKEKNIKLTDDNVKMTEEINKLINENIELCNKTSSVEKEYRKLSQKNGHYVKINEELNMANQQLRNDNNELLLKTQKNEANLNKMDIDNKQLSVDLVNLKLTFDKVKGTMEKFERFNETLIAENRTLQNSVMEKDSLCQQQDLEIKVLEDKCGTYENNINVVRSESDQSQKARIALENSLKIKEELLLEVEDKLRRNIENNALDVKSMQELIDEKQMKIEENIRDLSCQKKIEKELKTEFNKISKKLKQESEKCDSFSRKIAIIENELSEKNAACEKLKELFENLTQQNVKTKEIISKHESAIAFLERENEMLNEQNNSLKNKSEQSDKKLAELLKTNGEFLKTNRKITEENVELSLKCTKLSEELLRRKEMLEKANADIEEIWDELKKTKTKVSENEQERLGLYKKKMDRYEEENVKTKKEIESLQCEKEVISQKSKFLEKENIEVKKQLENLLIEKDLWLTEKINIHKNENDASLGMAQAITSNKSVTKTTTFDRLALKTMKLDERITVLEERLSVEKHKNGEKLKEITKLQDKNEILSIENARMKKEIDVANEDNEYLRGEMEELIAKVDELIEENQKLTKINEEFENVQWKFDNTHTTLTEEAEVFEDAQENSRESNSQEAAAVYELTHLREQLENELEKRDLMLTYIDTVRDRLCKRRLRLGRATVHAMNVWKNNLDDDVVTDASKEGLQPEHLMRPLPGPLDEEILQVEHQIHVTSSLLDKLTSMKNHKLLESSLPVQTSDFHDTIEPETSSNIDSNVLENLGLSGDCIRINDLSAVEMEEKFTALVLAFTIDRTSLRRRYTRQKTQLREKEHALGEEISTLTVDLEKYTNEMSEIDVLSRLEHILRLSAQISISAEQYGSLTQQSNLSQGVELMMNYVATLRRNIESPSSPCLSIEPFPETVCQNNEIQLIEKDSDAHDLEVNLHVENSLIKKTSWNKEIHFMFTLSMAVLVAVIFLNTWGSYNGSLRISPLTPPT